MKSILIAFIAILSCLCYYGIKQKKGKADLLIWVAHFIVFGVAAYFFTSTLLRTFHHPQVWDFSAFYLWGKTANAGYDFYSPENALIVFNSLSLPDLDYSHFVTEVVNVGFYYPPQTMLYFAPLGFLSYHTAFLVWTILNLFFVLGCIYLLYGEFFREQKLNGLLVVSTLVFAFVPSRETILFSQTNFMVLFYLLLVNKYADKKIAGVFLALAVFTKPYIIVLLLYFIARKRWKAIGYFMLSVLVISAATWLVFGSTPIHSYIFNNPSHRIPPTTFSESINQSLHAVLLRAGFISLEKPLIYIIILIVAVVGTVIYITFLAKRRLYDDLMATLLLVGLLLYPGTLSYYAVVLLFVTFQFLSEKKELGFRQYANLLIIGIAYCLTAFSVFSCLCFLLALIILKSLNVIRQNNPGLKKSIHEL